MIKDNLRFILKQRFRQTDLDWFDSLELAENDGTLRVVFPHAYFSAWFAMHKQQMFEQALAQHYVAGLPKIEYQSVAPSARLSPLPDAAQPARHARQNTEDLFASFIHNDKNAFPLTCVRAIANGNGRPCNPFLLCGVNGTGKSHLLGGIALAFNRLGLPGRILHERASVLFASHPAWLGRPESFWQYHDFLVLDDIQDLLQNPAWQTALAAIIDACPTGMPSSLGTPPACRLVLAFSGQAQDMHKFDKRLLSRLECGLVVELMPPDLDVRLRFLQERNRERQLNLDRDQLVYIAQRCLQFRLIQGMLLKIEMFAGHNGRDLSISQLENIIRTGGVGKPAGCREIAEEVGHSLRVRTEDIMGNKRRPELVFARQMAMYICRERLGLSYPELGKAFGGKDHSTVIYAIKKIKERMVSDKDIHRLVTELQTKAQY